MVGWIVGVSGIAISVGWGVTLTQPVTRRQKITNSVLAFIFNPFDGYNGDIEVPELIQETTQGGLVGEGTNQKGFAILLGN
jgi:hypothetical protein